MILALTRPSSEEFEFGILAVQERDGGIVVRQRAVRWPSAKAGLPIGPVLLFPADTQTAIDDTIHNTQVRTA